MQFRLGPWVIRPEMGTVASNGETSHVSPKAMEVLVCLARRQGQVVGKDEIFREVWTNTFVSDDSLTRCIVELRRTFRDDAREPTLLKTIPKRGYVLLSPVEWDESGRFDEAQPSAFPLATGANPDAGSHSQEDSVERHRFSLHKRDIALMAAVLMCVLIALIPLNLRRPTESSRAHVLRTVAVLPLANLSADPEQEYFADGMTEQLITELARMRAFDVISRTSVMRYKGVKRPLRDVARELSADAVVEGTVLRSGMKVRVTAQLIDSSTDKHLWSDSFERDLGDVIPLQASIAHAIAEQLNVTLSPGEQERSGLSQKVNPDAYDAYLRGWYFQNRAQYAKAASYFEKATVADPNFALAHALLFEADSMIHYGQDEPFSQRALQAIEKARQMDDTLAEVHDGLGDVLTSRDWDWTAAGEEYRRAVELNPASVDAALHYAYWFHVQRRWQEAEEQVSHALRIDPVSPQINAQMLMLMVNTHQYERAVRQFHKLVELEPSYIGAYYLIGIAHWDAGNATDAAAAFTKMEALAGASPNVSAELSAAAFSGTLHQYAEKRITQLRRKAMRSYVSPLDLAAWCVLADEKEQAISFLQQAHHSGRVARLSWINANALFDPLRPDPRFQAVLRGMHLAR
jgi:TolB-like protein/DNA-binding winged helix-turn-helix (wHTH) protein/tetratricopeptide (TPR) repeat protein